jgi:acetyl-CoA synthetase
LRNTKSESRPPSQNSSPSPPTSPPTKEGVISALWVEEGKIPPPPELKERAHAPDGSIFDRFSEERFPECFREYADMLEWSRPWEMVLDTSEAPFWKWFTGGELNASHNCLDRHLARRGDKVAYHFVPEDEKEPLQSLTYRELHRRVNEFAVLLREFAGLRKGDRVTFHLPMTPELPISMLAAARLGVVHSEVFGGFSGQACGARIADSGSSVLVTLDGYARNGRTIDHKANADVAVETARKLGQEVRKVLVWRRYPGRDLSQAPMVEGRDYYVDELLPRFRGTQVPPEPVRSEDPLFLMYTSGTTGKPKGCQHSTGGYLAYVTGTSRYVLDLQEDDIYWCMADIGWITGHSYIVYGPLSLGATSVLYEGVPSYPDAARPWRLSESLGVTVFHTSPTAIRQLRKSLPEGPRGHNVRFRLLTTVGEPIEPEVWKWYFDVVGGGRAAITDTWWQTETGGFLCSTLPAVHPMKPGSAGPPLPGIFPVILDEDGREVPKGMGHAGNLCIRNPWPGVLQTIWGSPERYVAQYYHRYSKKPGSKDWRDWPYLTGDGAIEGADGYFRIIGRIDDVIKVAGHRLGAKELESACLTVPEVAEAAAVPLADEVKGRVPDIYVSLKPGSASSPEVVDKVRQSIVGLIGKIAAPQHVYVVEDMPKTRSGKIMRRVLAALSNGADCGDTSTLVNPEVVENIRRTVGTGASPKTGLSREAILQEVRDLD